MPDKKKHINPLNIWILQTGEPLHIDGANTRPMRAMNLSNALVEAGHKVVLWSSAFYHQEKRHRKTPQERIKYSENLEIRLIPSCGYKRNIGLARFIDHAQLALSLKKMLKQDNDLPDVAFIGYPPIEPAAVMARWLLSHRVPTILDVKDQWPSFFLEAVPKILRPIGRIVLWPYFYLARRAMRETTCLSSMSNSYLDWAREFAGRSQTNMDGVFPLTTPSNQATFAQLEEARNWWDGKGVLANGTPRVCFVGSHSPAFDFKPVLDAAKNALKNEKPCEFVICGDGGTSHELRTMMAELPNVYFPGWIDRPKIEVLAERCFASLAPYLNIDNFKKNIPNKIIDSLSLGLPILSPLQGEVASLINKYGVGLRYGTDSGQNLYKCIDILINDPIFHNSMSQKAKELYIDQFSFEIVYQGLVEHFEKMANK